MDPGAPCSQESLQTRDPPGTSSKSWSLKQRSECGDPQEAVRKWTECQGVGVEVVVDSSSDNAVAHTLPGPKTQKPEFDVEQLLTESKLVLIKKKKKLKSGKHNLTEWHTERNQMKSSWFRAEHHGFKTHCPRHSGRQAAWWGDVPMQASGSTRAEQSLKVLHLYTRPLGSSNQQADTKLIWHTYHSSFQIFNWPISFSAGNYLLP